MASWIPRRLCSRWLHLLIKVNYTENQDIGYSPFLHKNGGYYVSKDRDNRSHFVYVGAEHDFLANLSVDARVGVQYNDTYNDPLSSSQYTPYANLSATYTYLPGSYVQLGVTHALNATDVSAVNAVNGTITQNQETTTLYGSINHHITADLLGSIVAQWQNSSFSGGAYNNDTENDYSAGVSLTYNISRHFSCDAGYNYDKLQDDSIANRGYERNRVYVGVTPASILSPNLNLNSLYRLNAFGWEPSHRSGSLFISIWTP